MARSLNAPAKDAKTAGKGHNLGLTDEERLALFRFHLQTCREADAALEKAMEAVRAVRKVRNKQRHDCMQDGYPLAKVDDILKKERAGVPEKTLQDEAELFHWMDKAAGMPVGGQLELFANTPAETKDGLDWKAAGYRAGLAGQDAVVPKDCPQRFHQLWLEGRMSGQQELAWSLSAAGVIVDRRTKPAEEPKAAVEEPKDDDLSEAEIRKRARKLKGSGFMETKGAAAEGGDGGEADAVGAETDKPEGGAGGAEVEQPDKVLEDA